MADMFSQENGEQKKMTDLAAYRFILLERECVKNRATCNKDCSSCSYSTDSKDLEKALTKCVEVLKARNPQLYLATELEQLTEVIRIENKYKETE